MKGNKIEGQAENKRMTFLVLALLASSVILANPVWCLTDLLPDALAWLLIWFALQGLAGMNDNMVAARRQALYLLAVETVKLLIWIPLQSSQIPSDRMLAALVFSAGEAALMLLFFRSFLNGAEELSRTGGGDRMYLKTGDVRFLCSLFVIVRAGCTILPELTAIPQLYVENVEITDDILWELLQQVASSGEILTVVFSVLELIMAVVWLVSYLPFLRLFQTERDFCAYLSTRLAPDGEEHRMERRFSALHMARICFGIGLACSIDFHINGIPYLPLFALPAFFAIGCIFLNRLTEDQRFRLPLVAAVISAVLFLLAELYKLFFTVWDMVVFAELKVGTELISAGWMLVCMVSLFVFWLLFSGKMETLSKLYECGSVYFTGLPYWLLAVYALLQAAVFVLPLAAWYVNTIRVIAAAALWICANRRLAALEEQIHEVILIEHPVGE